MSKPMFFAVAALILAISGWYYRSQNGHLAQAKAAHIVEQDVAGRDTTSLIADLKAYTAAHMGATVSFTLSGSYNRAQAAAQAAANATASQSQIYADAQRICSGKSDSITQARCNQDYISKHLSAAPASTPIPEPTATDYQRVFRAPVWTPDLAGALFIGAAAALAFGLIALIRRPH